MSKLIEPPAEMGYIWIALVAVVLMTFMSVMGLLMVFSLDGGFNDCQEAVASFDKGIFYIIVDPVSEIDIVELHVNMIQACDVDSIVFPGR